MGVGDAEGVGRRAVADDLAVDLRPAGLGVFEFFEHDHAAPSPSTKPSRSRSNGREACCGSSLRVRKGREQVEAGHAEGVDHAVRAAGEHHVGVAAADDLGRLADRLAAGGAGRQAVDVRPLGVEHAGQVAGRHVRLLFQLADGMEQFQARCGELGHVELCRRRARRPSSGVKR